MKKLLAKNNYWLKVTIWEHDHQHQEQFVLKINIQKTTIKIKTHSATMIHSEKETIALPLEACLEPYQRTTMTLFCEHS